MIKNLQSTGKVYTRRWYILFVFSLVSFLQSAFWITFSCVADETKDYYQTDDFMVNFLLALGAIFYIPVVPFVMWAFSGLKDSLHRLVILSTLLCALGTLLRCLSFISPRSWWALWVVSLGQVFIAVVGPVVMTAPPFLSAKWFPAHERTIATAIASSANNLGSGVGFVVAPYLVDLYGFRMFLVIEAAVAALAFLLSIAYFPDSPPIPPTLTASRENIVGDRISCKTFLRGIYLLVTNWSFLVLALVGGWQSGLLTAWQGMFDYLLVPQFSEIFVGWLGFFFIATSTVGGVVGGVLCDKLWQRRFKMVLLVLFAMLGGTLLLFGLSFPSFLSDKPLITLPKPLIAILLVAAGFFYGFTSPVFYELGVELTYPLSTSLSSGFYTFLINVAALVVLLTGPEIPVKWITGMAAFSILACLIPLGLIKEEYRRLDVDMMDNVNMEN